MTKVDLMTYSEEETMALGEFIGTHAVDDLFLALNGDLGTGKTHFVQGLAKGMGIDDSIGSPTFMIMNYYDGNLPLKHFDFYRLDDEEDLYNIGWDEYSRGGVTVVEWAELFPALVPLEGIAIRIERIDNTVRRISLSWGNGAPESVVKEIEKYVACH